jgi:hypothetical protein
MVRGVLMWPNSLDSASEQRYHWHSWKDGIFVFLFCPQIFREEGGLVLEMKKASRENGSRLVPNPKARLFDQIREVMRFRHYSYRTEQTYSQWIRRFLSFHRKADHSGSDRGWRHPRAMGAVDVAAFLSHLAVAGNVAASTQNQALNALVFLYEEVLQITLGDIGDFARVKRPPRLPEVLTQEETRHVPSNEMCSKILIFLI